MQAPFTRFPMVGQVTAFGIAGDHTEPLRLLVSQLLPLIHWLL